MARFQVPQFIEIEQKVIAGILTMRQFITVAVGIGVLFGLFIYLNFFIWIILAILIGAGIFAVSFLKISGRSLSSLIKAAFYYYWNPSYYLWRSETEYESREFETTTIEREIKKESKGETLDIALPKTFKAYSGQSEYKKPEIKTVIPEERKGPAKKASGPPPEEIYRSYSSQSEIKKTDAKTEIHEIRKESEEETPTIPSLKTFKSFLSREDVKKIDTKPVSDTSREEPDKKASRSVLPKTFKSYSAQINKLYVNRGKPEPKAETKPASGTPALTHRETRARLKIGDQIQSLWEKISTSRTLVPKRESRMNAFQKERIEAGYQAMRKSTGEIEVAKRVDFK